MDPLADGAPEPLPGLPGADLDAGWGPVVDALLEGLLADGAGLPRSHAEHRSAWYGHVVGPLVLDAGRVDAARRELTAADHGVRVVLATTGGPHDLRAARDLLLEPPADRLEADGVRFVVTGGGPGARRALDALDASVPAWMELPPVDGWRDALEEVARDGAEHAAVRVTAGTGPQQLAAFVRAAVDLDVAFCVVVDGAVVDGDRLAGGLPVWVPVLCAVRAALNGAEEPELAAVLAERRPAPLASALRRMSEADAAVTRAFLASVTVPDVRADVDALVAAGLLAPPR